jgi:transcriptional regulator with XRE-family HTH domain
MALGDTIKAYRIARGLKQTDLAERAQLDQGHISRIENNSFNPRWETIIVLAQALEITPNDLWAPPAEILALLNPAELPPVAQ